MKRSSEQIERIKKGIENPRSIYDFLTDLDINHLVCLFNENRKQTGPYTNVIYKNTGPITLDLQHYLDDPVIEKILKKIEANIGPFNITAAFFFYTDYPHIIHNDDTFELPDTVYKAITIPLHLEEFNGQYPKLCFFNQFYFHGPAKFFAKDKDIPTYYNKQVYDYSEVDGITKRPFIDNEKLFTHLKPHWLEGLSLHSTLDWIPGNALIFDSVRLHCASDFRQLGIKSKLGISIFTKQ